MLWQVGKAATVNIKTPNYLVIPHAHYCFGKIEDDGSRHLYSAKKLRQVLKTLCGAFQLCSRVRL